MNLQRRRKRDRFVWRRRAGLLSGGSFPTKSTCFCWTWWAFPLGARTPWNILLKDSWCSFLHLKHNFTQLWHWLVGLTDPLILEDLPDSQVWEVWVLRCPPASHGRTRSPAHYSHVFVWLLIALAILTPASQRSFFNMCFTRIRQGHTSHWVFPKPHKVGLITIKPTWNFEAARWRHTKVPGTQKSSGSKKCCFPPFSHPNWVIYCRWSYRPLVLLRVLMKSLLCDKSSGEMMINK